MPNTDIFHQFTAVTTFFKACLYNFTIHRTRRGFKQVKMSAVVQTSLYKYKKTGLSAGFYFIKLLTGNLSGAGFSGWRKTPEVPLLPL